MIRPPLAITGLGAVTACGTSVRALWSSLIEGRSGIGLITHFDTSEFDVHIAGEVRGFQPADYGIDPKEARRLDRFAQFALAAAQEAAAHAGLRESPVDPERVGVIIGTGIGGIRSTETQMDILRKKGPSRVSPLLVPSGTPDVASNEVALLLGYRGPSFAVSTACSSGNDAIIAAARCLNDGAVDVMLAGGAEAPISELAISTFANLRALSRAEGDPQTICRPFDRDRSGFVIGEGAGILVLETLEHARRCGAEILALLAGYGQSTDAYHKTAPDPTGAGAARAMRQAIASAGVLPAEIGYINAHGTSTQQNDPMETLAIHAALGAAARQVPVSSTKSMTGHLIAGAGAVESIISVLSIRTGTIPPTLNLDNPDPECDLFHVAHAAIDRRVDVALSNSFGFGGHNSSLIFCRA